MNKKGRETARAFGIRLKTMRYMNRMTQDDLAKKLGSAKNTIYYWESGQREPSFEMVEKSRMFSGRLRQNSWDGTVPIKRSRAS